MTVQEELISLGQILKKKRSEKNLSLKEIENATSIRMNYLSAIEDGQLSKLISPIYAQGFIKKYASHLEMDSDLLFSEHPTLKKALSEPRGETSDFTLGLGSVEVRGNAGGEVKWLPNLMWVGLSAIGILTIWFLARYFELI